MQPPRLLYLVKRAALVARMARLRTRILRHMALDPDNFDGRERLWMEHQALRARLRALDAQATAAQQHWMDRVLDGQDVLAFGVGVAVVVLRHGGIT